MLPQLPHPLPSDQAQFPNLTEKRTGLRYKVDTYPTAEPEFFQWYIDQGNLRLLINEDHPFYQRVYRPLVERNDQKALFNLESLLIAYSRCEAQRRAGALAGTEQTIREVWSHILAALLS